MTSSYAVSALSMYYDYCKNVILVTQEWSPSHYSAKLKKEHAPKAESVPSYPGSESAGIVPENSNQSEQKTVSALNSMELFQAPTQTPTQTQCRFAFKLRLAQPNSTQCIKCWMV